MMSRDAKNLAASLLVGVFCALVALAPGVRASGADTVAGRYGAAVFACRNTLDLRQVDWADQRAAAGTLPYYLRQTDDGAVVSVFGPMPAWLGAPFMDGLAPGSVLNDMELERRARHAAAFALGLAVTLLCAALTAQTTALRAALLALVTGLSFAGAPTLGQALWQQTVLIVPLTASLATLSWSRWRGGALLVLTPGLLLVSALTRPNAVFLVSALGVMWLLAVRRAEARRIVVPLAVVMTLVLAGPQLAWNVSVSHDPLAIHTYLAIHTTKGAEGMHFRAGWFLTSLLGLLVSPARGLALFAPLLLVGLYAALRQRDVPVRVLAVGILLHVGLVAFYFNWWGGWGFGPRMLAETVWLAPFLVTGGAWGPGLRRWLVAAGTITAGVGLLGTFRYQAGVWDVRRDPDAHNEALWDLVDSPLVAMVRRKADATIDAPMGPYLYCVDEPVFRTLRKAPPNP